jgi:hypothetical protein
VAGCDEREVLFLAGGIEISFGAGVAVDARHYSNRRWWRKAKIRPKAAIALLSGRQPPVFVDESASCAPREAA